MYCIGQTKRLGYIAYSLIMLCCFGVIMNEWISPAHRASNRCPSPLDYESLRHNPSDGCPVQTVVAMFRVSKTDCRRLICHSQRCHKASSIKLSCRQTLTRKLCYRKDDRAMRPIHGCTEKFRDSLTIRPRLLFPKFFMGFCCDRLYECS